MKSRLECADCSVDNSLGDGACCPWPNKDDFCKAWKPSQTWKQSYKARLRKTCQAARTWKKMYGKNKGTLSTGQLKKQVSDIRAAVLLTRQVQAYVNMESARMMETVTTAINGCLP